MISIINREFYSMRYIFLCTGNSKAAKRFNLPIGTLIPRLASKYLLCNHCVVEKGGWGNANHHSLSYSEKASKEV